MSIIVNCSIELTEEELFHVLLLRHHGGVPEYPTKSTASEETKAPDAPTPNVTFNSPEPEVIPEARIDEDYPATEGIPPPRLPKTPRRAKAALSVEEAINSTPLAPPPPPPEALDEPAMRSLLSKVGAVHPNKVKAITDLLEYFGGKRRLSECDPSTWPAIAAAAHDLLAEYGA